ncbi:hypothetical protein Btru_033489 [Bulinus truncatus]|nr:hypothetical protein Btru_033489 [Bulinus truncatus]
MRPIGRWYAADSDVVFGRYGEGIRPIGRWYAAGCDLGFNRDLSQLTDTEQQSFGLNQRGIKYLCIKYVCWITRVISLNLKTSLNKKW